MSMNIQGGYELWLAPQEVPTWLKEPLDTEALTEASDLLQSCCICSSTL